MRVDAIWTELTVRATVKHNAELQALLVHKKWMQQQRVTSAIHPTGNRAGGRPVGKGKHLPISHVQLQLKAMSSSTRHTSSGALARAITKTRANTLTTKFLLDRVALKGEGKAATAEATFRDVHLQTLVLQRKRKLFYETFFQRHLHQRRQL